MEIYKIVIADINTKVDIQTSVEVDEAEVSENIVITTIINGHTIISSNYNYLSAYQDFRDKLLELGFGIKCNGSKINAVQSSMMSATDKIYLVEIGKKAQMKNIVYIWDYADIDEFPDTKQQIAFFEQWAKQ